MRLAKYLAHAGIASRRASEVLIAEGRVSVDGEKVLDPARDVDSRNKILFDGERVGSGPAIRVVYALNKPSGVVSTAADTHGRPTVVEMVRSGAASSRRLYPVGRLDVDSTGLILLTDDGDLAHRLTHPSFEVPKRYIARVSGGAVSERALQALRDGIFLDDGKTAPAKARQIAAGHLELTIHEGRKRQVRRMCEAVGHPVRELKRVGFGSLDLGAIPEGKSRRLSLPEVEALLAPTDQDRVA
ncbi:MAG: pseudouridine synthase [Actinobacteria bacterium]|uniref:Unannotated protein n=1 Tax=freshwater metagenome TaxID=449393 RepID=A0A6J5ZSK0_9ZZZZ|nr:pseudouridine synthase [Actinomycetota bacterium]